MTKYRGHIIPLLSGTNAQRLGVTGSGAVNTDNTDGSNLLLPRLFVEIDTANIYIDPISDGTWIQVGGTGGSSPLTVQEEDGSPSVSGVVTIKVPNTSLTNNGSGSVSLGYELAGAVAAHVAALDPHTQYATDTDLTTHNHTGGGQGVQISHHSALTDLTAFDDHTQYALLAGRSGGQTLNGDTASGGNLTLMSTAHATKGAILIGASRYDEVNDRLIINGSSSSFSLAGTTYTSRVTVNDEATANVSLLTLNRANNTAGIAPIIYLNRAKNTVSSPAIVASQNTIGGIFFTAYDGANYLPAANIHVDVDGTPGVNDMPGRMTFAVTADGASGTTDAMLISNDTSVRLNGYLRVGTIGVAPTNTTAGDLTAIRLIVPNATILHSAIVQLGGPVVIPTAGALRFSDTDDSNYAAFKAGAMSANVTWTLPTTDGANGQVLKTNGSAVLSWTGVPRQFVWAPDAGPATTISAGNQQGNIFHSGPLGFTAVTLYVDAETAPGAAGLPITIEYGDTNDLDTVASWTTVATYTLSSEKSNKQTTMTNAAVPADRLLRMNVGTIVGSPADATITLEGTVP